MKSKQIKQDAYDIMFFLKTNHDKNHYKIRLKKDKIGEFKLNGLGSSLSNYQFKGDYITECEWEADQGNWEAVIKFIESSGYIISEIRSR